MDFGCEHAAERDDERGGGESQHSAGSLSAGETALKVYAVMPGNDTGF